MYYLLGFVYMCIIPRYLSAIEPVVTYTGSSICNQTVVLGSTLYSAIVDFSLESRLSNTVFTFSCSFRVETDPGSIIAIKYLSSPNTNHEFNSYECRTKMTMLSNELNIKQCNYFPETELSSYEYVDIQYEIQRIKPTHRTGDRLKMLFFTYSYHNRIGRCQVNESLCFGSRRCIYGPLQCSRIYDFCHNNMRNCPKQISRSRSVSFSGVYIFISCLIFLLGVTIYMCFCKGIHLFECICHCCSAIETTGSQRIRRSEQENDSAQTGNGNGEDTSTLDNVSNNENENDNNSADESLSSVVFGLPPSYSYIERIAPTENFSGSDSNGYGDSELNIAGISKETAELPPSYSTVLGHEEEYNVHVIL